MLAFLLLSTSVVAFGPVLVPLAVAAFGLAWSVVRRTDDPSNEPLSSRALGWILCLEWALSIPCLPWGPPRPSALIALCPLLTLALLLLALRALRSGELGGRRAVALLLLVYLAAGLVLLRVSPSPRIDVFALQQAGARELLAGRDPYLLLLPNTLYGPEETLRFFGDHRRVLWNYPYPPLSLLATIPAYLVAGDVRYGYLALQLLCGLLIYEIARRAGRSHGIGLGLLAAHLLQPRGLFVLDQSWTEPLVAAGMLLLMLPTPRALLSGTAFAVVIAGKQYGILLAPLLLSRRLVNRRTLLLGCGLALLATLPMALWDMTGFIDDVILFQLRQPFRADSVSLPALVAAVTGLRLPEALAPLVGLGIGLGLVAVAPSGPRTLALGSALVLFGFFLTAKQAFCNYYYLVGVLLVGAAAAPAGAWSLSPCADRKVG